MFAIVLMFILAVVFSTASVGAASPEVEALKEELRKLQEEHRRASEAYTKAIEELNQKIQALEKKAERVEPAAPPPAKPSLIPGFLFDLSFGADFVLNLTSRGAEKGHTGTFAGRENRLLPREIELTFQGAVDPYARADCFVEIEEEAKAKGGALERELVIDLDECYATFLTLPLGLQAKAGKLRPPFGRINLHEHQLPQVDRPNAATNFFGEEQLQELGVSLSYLLPTPFYQELNLGVFQGDNDVSFGRGSFRRPLVLGHLKNFFDLTERSTLQVGFSGATGSDDASLRSTLLGLDLTYKWRPLERPFPAFTLQGEFLYSHRQLDKGRTLDRYGLYAFGDYRLARRWAFGTRFDWSQFPTERGIWEWALAPVLTFWPSEFLRLRVEYKHTERFGRGIARDADGVFFQLTFGLGPHRPHLF
ncbi:MAG: hypothetical protein ACK4Z6_03025 [Candidatus Methylomirabilales bacterium]